MSLESKMWKVLRSDITHVVDFPIDGSKISNEIFQLRDIFTISLLGVVARWLRQLKIYKSIECCFLQILHLTENSNP